MVAEITCEELKKKSATSTIFLQHFHNKSQVISYCGDHFCARPRGAVVTKAQSPTLKENSPTCYFISCETKGVVYH